VSAAIVALLVVVAAILATGNVSQHGFAGLGGLHHGGVHGVLQAAALLFFAFAGYARIATLGEEVREPARTIPRAIPIALAIVVVLYVVVGATALAAAGPATLAGAAWAQPVVRIGAAVASLGALLALIAGIGRTTLAMARNGDLPHWLASVESERSVP